MSNPTLTDDLASFSATETAKIPVGRRIIKRLQSIEDAKMPEEPRSLRRARAYDSEGYVMGNVRVSDIINHIDALLVFAQSETAKRLEADARVKELDDAIAELVRSVQEVIRI